MIAGQVRTDAACPLLIRRKRLRLGGLGCTRGPRSVVLSTHNAPTTTQKESPLGTATAVAHHDRRARHIALCPDLRRDVSCGGGDRGRHAESSPAIMAYAP